MDSHVKSWLGAYMDGELYGSRLETVERHLATCPECREDLDELRKLSVLLQGVPALQPNVTPVRFASQVKHRLPRTPARSPWSRFWDLSWRAAPFLLIGMWTFSQVVLLFSSFVSLGISSTGLVFPDIDFLPGLMPLPYSLLNELGTTLFNVSDFEEFGNFDIGSGFLEVSAASLLVTAGVAVLLWSWLASWLAFSRSRLNPLLMKS